MTLDDKKLLRENGSGQVNKVYIVMQNDGIVSVWDNERDARIDVEMRKNTADAEHARGHTQYTSSSLHLRYEEFEVQSEHF